MTTPYFESPLQLIALKNEITAMNTKNGWRDRKLNVPESLALIHSEVSEALEAFRDHGLEDATQPASSAGVDGVARLPKPEGVGAELADVFIRCLDHLDRFGESAAELPLGHSVSNASPPKAWTFGQHIFYLHQSIHGSSGVTGIIKALYAVCHRCNIDLPTEVRRKLDYNKTRPYRHGGKNL